MNPSAKLIIFVKAPVPGKVKTRLVPPLTHARAAAHYESWAKEIFKRAQVLDAITVEIAYAHDPLLPTPQWLDVHSEPIPYFLQIGDTLGERLTHAFNTAFHDGYKTVVAIGSDSPGLPIDYIRQAFTALKNHDCTIGKTEDGGYYLVGLSHKIPNGIFENISWSTSHVFNQTLQKAIELNLSVQLLPEYFDIDRPTDLERLTVHTR